MVVDDDGDVLVVEYYRDCEHPLVGELLHLHAIDCRLDDELPRRLADRVVHRDRAHGAHASGGQTLLLARAHVVAREGQGEVAVVVDEDRSGQVDTFYMLLQEDRTALEEAVGEGQQGIAVARVEHDAAGGEGV